MPRSVSALLVCSLFLASSSTLNAATASKGAVQRPGKCSGSLCSFDPSLRGGRIGNPGLRARLNERMFRYASQMLGEMISREIQHARLPDIIQTTESLLDERIVLYNGYVARYRCPQRVVVLPKAPNHLMLQLQNFDVGINTKIAGHFNLGTPMVTKSVVPSGVLQINLHGLILGVEIGIDQSAKSPKIAVVSCSTYIDKVDISMEKTGKAESAPDSLSFLKKFISKFVRERIPEEICKMVRKITDEQLNSRLASIPQSIAVTQLSTLTGLGLFSAPRESPDPAWCDKVCGMPISGNGTKKFTLPSFPGLSAWIAAPPKSVGGGPKKRPLCSQCTDDNSAAMMQGVAKFFNLQKLTDLFLNVKLLKSAATDETFSADLSGEFSPGGRGGTPFSPFPTVFPFAKNDRMLEAIVTDYTVNSLLYWVHRKGFMTFKIGPDVPTIGELLRTTCEATGVEGANGLEESEETEEEQGSLKELGLCLGDLFPSLRGKHPDKEFYIVIRSTRAPSVILSEKKGLGCASVEMRVAADLFFQGTTTKVGTMSVNLRIEVTTKIVKQRLFGMVEVARIKLSDVTGSLGLDEEALSNLGGVLKDVAERMSNDALKDGVPVSITQSPAQPSNFYNMQIKIIEHGLYVAGDFTVAPALLGTLGYSGSCYIFD